MSGRGRGRGRGRAPPSGARLLLQRSAQEAGLDVANLRGLQDITRPQLFPDYEWHSTGSLGHDPSMPVSAAGPLSITTSTNTTTNSNTNNMTNPTSSMSTTASIKKTKESTIYLINKSRGLLHRFQESPFYVRPAQEVDVVRYNKRPRPLAADRHIVEHIGKAADPRYIPSELLPRPTSTTNTLNTSLTSEWMIGEDGVRRRPFKLEDLAKEEEKVNRAQRIASAAAAVAGTATADLEVVPSILNDSQGKKGMNDDLNGESGELSDTLIEAEEDDDEEIADYTQDYYASDDEGGGADGDDDGGAGGDEAVM